MPPGFCPAWFRLARRRERICHEQKNFQRRISTELGAWFFAETARSHVMPGCFEQTKKTKARAIITMKKTILMLGGLALGAAAMLLPYSGKASIIGSKHDFSTETNYWVGGVASGDTAVSHGSTNVCGECHTIHHAQSAANGPLFIHSPSANIGSFKTYDQAGSGTFPSTLGITLGSGSLACLSCHDGSVAVNSQTSWSGGANGAATIVDGTPIFINSSAIVTEGASGNDLTHMHPIGVNYDAAYTALPGQINLEANTFNAPGNPSVGSVLENHQVECATCHDIHRTIGGSTTSGIYTIASGQALCLGCHNK
jgi:predicted CXXCH cytochrome family protein